MDQDVRIVRAAGLVGAAAAALSAGSDVVLQYTADPAHLLSEKYLYLLDRSPGDLLLGHNLGVFAILLQIAGFWAVGRGLAPGGRGAARAYFLVAAFAMAAGAAFHATFAPIGLALHGARAAGDDPARLAVIAGQARPAQLLLGTVALIAIATAALLFSAIVLRRRTAYPRWMAAVTPLTLSIVLGIAGRFAPPLRLILVPCGINCAGAVFFLLATVALWSRPALSQAESSST